MHRPLSLSLSSYFFENQSNQSRNTEWEIFRVRFLPHLAATANNQEPILDLAAGQHRPSTWTTFTAWRDILQWIWLGNCAASSWIITLTGMQIYTKLLNPLDNTASPQMLVTLCLLLLLFCFVLFSSISSNNRKRWKEVNNHKLQLDFFAIEKI